MIYRYFAAASVPTNVVSQIEGTGTPKSLKIKVKTMAPGVIVPIRDDKHNVLSQFEITSEMLQMAANKAQKGGVFNINHLDGHENEIGTWDKAYFENDGFFVEGSITCPKWIDRILKKDFSGLSPEGPILGKIESPNGVFIEKVSFLTSDYSPEGGACGNDICGVVEVKSMEGSAVQDPNIQMEAAWNPDEAAFWAYIKDKDGNINQSRAKKVFLLKRPGTDGTRQSDWAYPFVVMENGSPVPDEEGLMAAYKRAAQQGEKGLFGKIRSKMRSIGATIPPGLKGSKVEASYHKNDDGGMTFTAQAVEDDGEIIAEKELIFAASKIEGDTMVEETKEINNAKQEVIETILKPASSAVPPIQYDPEAILKATYDIDGATLKAMKEKMPVLEKDLKAAQAIAAEIPTLKEQLLKATEVITGYRVKERETLKTTLMSRYPPALWKEDKKIIVKEGDKEVEKVVPGIDVFVDEYLKDPVAMQNAHYEEMIQFAAAKIGGVKMEGSSAASVVETSGDNKKEKVQRLKDLGFI